MSESESLLKELKPIWPGIAKMVSADLQRTMVSLVDAVSIDDVRLLQGRALGYRSLLHIPEQLATIVASEKAAD